MAKKAYKNNDFLTSKQAREIRILSEYVHPRERLKEFDINSTIVFFGSARSLETPKDPNNKNQVLMAEYYKAGIELARLIAKWALEYEPNNREFIVVTGGGPGMMQAANRGAKAAGARTMGLNISLPFEQEPNPYLTPGLDFEFHYFFMRKYWLVNLSKAGVILPGGFGTFDEFFELLTLVQTGKIKHKFPIVLFGKTYWEKIINFQALADFGVINPEDLDLFHMSDDPKEAADWLTGQLDALYPRKHSQGK